MRKSLLACCFLLLGLGVQAQENRGFRAGFSAGLSASQVDGDTYSGYSKPGIAAGALLNRRFGEKWEGEFQILFIQKGSRKMPQPDKGDFNEYHLKLNYIEIPVLAMYPVRNFHLNFGASFSTLISQEEYDQFSNLGGTTPPVKRFELAYNAGIAYPIGGHIRLSGRYAYSILPIREHNSGGKYFFNRGQYNNLICITLDYRL